MIQLIKKVLCSRFKIKLKDYILIKKFKCIECKQELAKINENIKIIDKNILPLRSNIDSIKSRLKSCTGKMYGVYFINVLNDNVFYFLLKYLMFIIHLGIDQELEREKRKEDGKNQLLQRSYPEMWKAINWLRKCDKSTFFRGEVFEPLFTQV